MLGLLQLLVSWLCVCYHIQYGAARSLQLESSELLYDRTSRERAEYVRTMFIEAYEAYRRFAFGHDDLRPISKTYADSRNGWGATMVDALDCMQIMGLHEFYDEAVAHISQTEFTKTKLEVNNFETFIRYVAGLLSAYELSEGRDRILLDKAVRLADRLVASAWQGDNVMPWTRIYFDGRAPVREQVSVASVSLILEMYALTRHTGNRTYLEMAQKIQSIILEAPSPYPGLLPNAFWPPTGQVRNAWTTWGSGSDSAHEYLLKWYLLSGDARHLDKWKLAVQSSWRFLVANSTRGHVFLGESTGKRYVAEAAHLTTFAAGNWMLGAKILQDEEIEGMADELLRSALATHDMSTHGFGPDEYTVVQASTRDKVPRKYAKQADQLGIYCTKCSYLLRPETIESLFYAWRLTGNRKYQDRAWELTQRLRKLQVDSGGFAGIRSVFANKPRRIDHTESFFYAETLKYLYLIFEPVLSLNDYVFNTEAHPIAINATAVVPLTPPTSFYFSKAKPGGSSIGLMFGLVGAATAAALAHLAARLRERRAVLPSLSKRRGDGMMGTGGISRRSKSASRWRS